MLERLCCFGCRMVKFGKRMLQGAGTSFFLFVFLGALGGCGVSARELVARLDADPAWTAIEIQDPLPTKGWVRGTGEVLHVYIEGDGFAYYRRSRPSLDPTPRYPTALMLALQDDASAVAYISRPYQYASSYGRDPFYWTLGRFHGKVIDSVKSVLCEMKKNVSADRLVLYGYSGGAAVAVLLAAEVVGVEKIVTICGNLDIFCWGSNHNISQLIFSLNPKMYFEDVKDVKQIHFVGERDKNVSRDVVESFVESFLYGSDVSIVEIPGVGHEGEGWVGIWDDILNDYMVR